jgi:hypothetical protein
MKQLFLQIMKSARAKGPALRQPPTCQTAHSRKVLLAHDAYPTSPAQILRSPQGEAGAGLGIRDNMI